MKIKKENETNAKVEVEGGHTHTMFFADTAKSDKGFKEVRVQNSGFPDTYKGVEVSTFDDGTLIIGIPTNMKLHVTLRG